MRVVVRENGSRPLISTPARLNAPAGAKALADLLAAQEFADMAILTIDWIGDTITPVLTVKTVKWFPEFGGRRLESDWNISLEDAFGVDNFNNEVARDIVQELKVLNENLSQSGPPDKERYIA